MDTLKVPYKVAMMIESYDGDWTADEIAAGLAGTPRVDKQETWFENTLLGPVEITDATRIEKLEEAIRLRDQPNES